MAKGGGSGIMGVHIACECKVASKAIREIVFEIIMNEKEVFNGYKVPKFQ